MDFEFKTASRIIFGSGKADQIPGLWKSLGKTPLFIIANSSLKKPNLREMIQPHESFVVAHEPSIPLVEELCAIVRGAGVDVIIGIGGGSVLDAGKAAAAIAPVTGSVKSFKIKPDLIMISRHSSLMIGETGSQCLRQSDQYFCT